MTEVVVGHIFWLISNDGEQNSNSIIPDLKLLLSERFWIWQGGVLNAIACWDISSISLKILQALPSHEISKIPFCDSVWTSFSWTRIGLLTFLSSSVLWIVTFMVFTNHDLSSLNVIWLNFIYRYIRGMIDPGIKINPSTLS